VLSYLVVAFVWTRRQTALRTRARALLRRVRPALTN
jgi:hypothetical protein